MCICQFLLQDFLDDHGRGFEEICGSFLLDATPDARNYLGSNCHAVVVRSTAYYKCTIGFFRYCGSARVVFGSRRTLSVCPITPSPLHIICVTETVNELSFATNCSTLHYLKRPLDLDSVGRALCALLFHDGF